MTFLYLIRFLGPRWLLFRLKYSMQLRLNYFQRNLPQRSWHDIPDYYENNSALSFIPWSGPELQCKLKVIDSRNPKAISVLRDAESILQGEFVFFSFHRIKTSFPPNWHQNYFTGESIHTNTHWSKISDFSYGDIKAVWELNRFPWAITLARAYARTGEERFAEGFWSLFEDWMNKNPPNCGPNWKCGQEATFRLMAAAFARHVFSNSAATTEKRLILWRKFVYFTGRRIYHNINYALSQSNNHGISECVGLVLASKLLLGIPWRKRWNKKALSSLKKQVRQLIYSDGSFSQHSTIYHRVLLHDLVLYVLLERSCGREIDPEIIAAAKRASIFLHMITDINTGEAPLCGSNDGSNVLPFSETDYLDFRPTIQMALAVFNFSTVLKSGPWDEATLWISNHQDRQVTKKSEIEKENQKSLFFSADIGGWYLLQQTNTRLFFHLPQGFHHRPSQADLLHVDIWWQGCAITRDPGTFSYNDKGEFVGMLKETQVHNTIEVDSHNQMLKVGRFLFLPWPTGSVSCDNLNLKVVGSHNAYKDLGVIHLRHISTDSNSGWIIEDKLQRATSKRKEHHYRVHWLLEDYPYALNVEKKTIVLETTNGPYQIHWQSSTEPSDVSLIRADTESNRGWWSPYYLHASPALSFVLNIRSVEDVCVLTHFQPLKS